MDSPVDILIAAPVATFLAGAFLILGSWLIAVLHRFVARLFGGE
ncbi:MAG TPA: hypothetical protein PKD55_26420 [Bellilinea sp.]|nr:hypothetical protein [Bellilinea sp.]